MASVHAVSTTGFVQDIRTRSHHLTADEPQSLGGTDTGPAPYELLLSGLAACTAITLRMYADRKGWDLGRIEVHAKFLHREDDSETIDRVVTLSAALTPEQQARLADICEKTPVTKTIKRGTPIHTSLGAG